MKKSEQNKIYKETEIADLETELLKLKKSLISNSLKARAGKLENNAEIGKTKKDIARVLTVINMKKSE